MMANQKLLYAWKSIRNLRFDEFSGASYINDRIKNAYIIPLFTWTTKWYFFYLRWFVVVCVQVWVGYCVANTISMTNLYSWLWSKREIRAKNGGSFFAIVTVFQSKKLSFVELASKISLKIDQDFKLSIALS